MQRTYESGYQKRKKKHQLEEQAKKLPKVDRYFTPAKSKNPKKANESLPCTSTGESEAEHPADEHTDIENIASTTCTDDKATGSSSCSSPAIDKGKLTFTKFNDVGKWGDLTEEEISYWIQNGPEVCQHWDDSFENSKRLFKNHDRYCSKGLFKAKKANGEIYNREWLVYSPSTGNVYCFVCKLFSSSDVALACGGFSDWRNPTVITKHENSEDHRDALLVYLTRKRGSTLDSKLEEQIKAERQYWRHVLERVIAVICTLAERGLAFRGEDETFGSPNNGNYLGLLELIAKFDPFLSNHIAQYGNKGSGRTSYLSKTICDELIQLMADRVRGSILEDLKKAGYFSFSVDSTPDLSHVDQLTVIIRFVSPDDGSPIERFLTFLELENHSGEGMAELVVSYLTEECKIDFSKCRGQSYDNAANMSGKYNGMQQKILERNQHAIYIPCAGHSLNLVGRAAVDCCLDAVNFFSIVQETYNFFSSSTHRWAVLTSFLPAGAKVPKGLSDTRWEAHSKAVLAIKENYSSITEALDDLHTNVNEKGDTRRQAGNLLEKMEELEFVFLLIFWSLLLEEFHKTSVALQDSHITLNTCANLYNSLAKFVQGTREQFSDIEKSAKEKLPDVEYMTGQRRNRVHKKQANDGAAANAEENMSPSDQFRVKTFFPIIDALNSNLARRGTVYSYAADRFSFLVNFEMSSEELKKSVQTLLEEYPQDVDMNLLGELKHFHAYVKANYQERKHMSHSELYQIIVKDRVMQVFPNVETTLRMFLSLMVTNCSGERSFSQLKRIKNELRTTMTQEKLQTLSILCIENDKLRSTSFEDIIQDFSFAKSRKKMF